MPNVQLTDADVRILQALLDREKRTPRNTRGRGPILEPDGTSSDVYLFRVPDSGIPPIGHGEDSADMTGTGSFSGTGTFGPTSHATCEAYTIGRKNSCLKYTGLHKELVNLSDETITDGWCLGVKDKYGQWIAVPLGTPPGNDFFKANLTDRYEKTPDDFVYAWNDPDDSENSGTLPAKAVLVHTQTADTLNPEIYTLTIVGATSKTFTLTEDINGTASGDGTPTVPIVWDASAATVQALLVNFTVTGSGTKADPYVITGKDGNIHGLTADSSGLVPQVSHSPARFLNSATAMAFPMEVWLRLDSGASPDVQVDETQKGDGTLPARFRLTFLNIIDGSIAAAFDGGALSTDVDWPLTAEALQTALSESLACTVTAEGGGTAAGIQFDVEVTADNNAHTLRVKETNLFGDKEYEAWFSNGNECTGPFGGVDPSKIDGYTGPLPPSVTIDPSGNSQGPWKIDVLNANDGHYDLVVDGGSPTSVSFSACPTIAGFISNAGTAPEGNSCQLAQTGTASHDIEVFGGRLRNTKIPDQALILSEGCAKWELIGDCETESEDS